HERQRHRQGERREGSGERVAVPQRGERAGPAQAGLAGIDRHGSLSRPMTSTCWRRAYHRPSIAFAATACYTPRNLVERHRLGRKKAHGAHATHLARRVFAQPARPRRRVIELEMTQREALLEAKRRWGD